MTFRQKLKQRLLAKCSKCGNTLGSSFTNNFSSWFFHQQMCDCPAGGATTELICDPKTTSAACPGSMTVDFGERFQILGLIGEGGMGTVYKAIDNDGGSLVAIKVLKSTLARDEVATKRFEQEAAAVRKLNHPNLVAVLDVGREKNGLPYIVQEFVEGTDLATHIRQNGHLSVVESMEILTQMTQAATHAHTHDVIHRDLKPSNVLLSKNQDGKLVVKIVDFGIAKAVSGNDAESALTQTGEVFGSPAYMSPEQCLGESIDGRSDIYSLGCIAYEMLTGRNPFACDSPVQTILKHVEKQPEAFEIEFARLKIPDQVEKLVFKCLEKDPQKRFGTASDLEVELTKGRPASHWKRYTAFLSDSVIFAGIGILMAYVTTAGGPREWFEFPFACVGIVFYYAIVEGIFGGTFGKLRSGIFVTDSAGRKLGVLRSVFRILAIIAIPTTIYYSCTIVELMLLIGGTKFEIHWGIGAWILMVIAATLINQLAFSKRRQSTIDKLFDRLVVTRPVLEIRTAGGATSEQLAVGLMSAVLIVFLPFVEFCLEQKAVDKGVLKMESVVYAVRDIPEDQRIPADALVVRKIPERKIPAYALHESKTAVGRIAKYGVSAGQIVSQHDLAPEPQKSKGTK